MKKVTIHVTLKQAVLDPQGKAIQTSLHSLGFQEVEKARVGKYIELYIDETDHVETRVKEMCEKLLANPVIEDYAIDVEEAVRS